MAEYADSTLPTEAEAQEPYRDDGRLLSAIAQREQTAIGKENDQAAVDRANAINYYLGQPFGNEIEGRSQVVSKDVFDTVEWIKPSLLRIFAGGDEICQFTPTGEEDIESAEQESDYVNYVLQRKNNWFMTAHEWFTDALLTRNAYAMGYWEDQTEAVLERFQGLTEDQLALIGMDPTVEIVAHRAYPTQTLHQMPQMGPQGPIGPPQLMSGPAQHSQIAMAVMQALGPVMLHDVDVRRRKDYGCAKICVLPPERCLVAGDSKSMSVREDDFFEYWEHKTVSELRVQGFDVPDDIRDEGGGERGLIDQVRDISNSMGTFLEHDQTNEPALRKVKVRTLWIRHDYDEDGIAELRYVIAVGSTVLWNEECSSIPVASIVPYPMPHRHLGLAMYDVIGDLQLIRSAMLRAGIDNQYFINNTRTAVDKNLVNLDDFLVSRPGGLVRTDGSPHTSIMPFNQPDTVKSTMGFLEYLDTILEDRGGVSKPYAGADLQAINAQPGTIAQLTSAASQKIELIARVFAEGVKELFQVIHEITLSNATVQDKVQLRGRWVSVDPRQWKKRSDMILSVGLGVGNRQAHATGIAMLMQMQEKAAGIGLTSPNKIYNALSEYTKALGFGSAKQFFDEPPPGTAFPQQPPVQVQVAQIKAQADVLVERIKEAGTLSVEQLKSEAAATRSYFETMIESQNQAQDRYIRAVSEATDRMQELRLEAVRNNGGTTGDGFSVADAVNRAEKALNESREQTNKVSEQVKGLEGTVKSVSDEVKSLKKPRKRTIKAPSGKTYQIEDQ